ncbi:hypothetical protein SESBI_14230 [Sesbania bispinosa]|nr:hypothetical protein SESBI_14230 [Sesbania bispinosa]
MAHLGNNVSVGRGGRGRGGNFQNFLVEGAMEDEVKTKKFTHIIIKKDTL